MVVPTLQWYYSEVYLSPVDKCLSVTANFKLTSSGFLKLVVDFLRRELILSLIKTKEADSILVKFLQPDMSVAISSSKSVL